MVRPYSYSEGPHVDKDASAFKAEDMVEREIYLGQVEIRPGEVAIFDATVSAESD